VAQTVVSPQLRAEAARIFQDLARVRGVSAPGAPPRFVVRPRDERRRFIVGELARKYSPARLDAERRALSAWGLVPPDFDLGGFLTDLVLEQAAAYYDPVRKVMVLANWLRTDDQRDALTHEMVHALQDRQMDLDRFLTPTAGQGDHALARQALVEGEAVALTHDLALRREGRDLASLPDVASLQRAILASATGPLLGRAPRFLRAMLTFPYAYGVSFVHQFRRRQPWSEVSGLYRDPPRSSSQILHPERYLDRRQDPVAVTLPDLRGVLGPGARRVFEDEMGEFGLREALGQALPEGARVDDWQGDRYAVWEPPDGRDLLVTLSVWGTDASALDVVATYAQVIARKHGFDPPAGPGPLAAWSTSTHAFVVERRGREVLTIEWAPGPAVDGLRDAVWESRPRARDLEGRDRFASVGLYWPS
jgi:hypothetical protein